MVSLPRDIDLIKISQDKDYRESLEVAQTSYPRLGILSPPLRIPLSHPDLNFIVESSKLSAEQDCLHLPKRIAFYKKKERERI